MAESTWIEKNQPEIWKKTSKFVLLSGYLSYRLTGQHRDSIASQVGYIPFDYKSHKWASASDWKWQATRLQPSQLSELVKPGELIGQITKEASLATGIPEGLPLIASGADKACEILGSGVSDESTAHLSFGTTATVNVLSKKYHEAVRFMPPYPSAILGQYSMEIQIFRGFWMVSWFKKQFGFEDEKEAAKLGKSAEQLLEERIQDI
ncbi:MAG: carbohydrate kinase, partial [Leptonema sp. (in: Bacteria)]|nr:carbohydrate kinase [Leptonema sp. (in: bacteria)]